MTKPRLPFLFALVAAVSFACGGCASQVMYGQIGWRPSPDFDQSEQPHDPVHISSQEAFDFACSVLAYDCSGVAVPKIGYTNLYQSFGYWGVYNDAIDENVIWLDIGLAPYLDRNFLTAVLAHETTHYLDKKLHKIADFDSKEGTCETEWNAWRVDNAYLASHGKNDITDFTWAERYHCFGATSVESTDEDAE